MWAGKEVVLSIGGTPSSVPAVMLSYPPQLFGAILRASLCLGWQIGSPKTGIS